MAVKASKTVLTTGQAAKLAGVAPRTMAKWCDGGLLPYYRLPTVGKRGDGDRRIRVEDLRRFIAAHSVNGCDETLLESFAYMMSWYGRDRITKDLGIEGMSVVFHDDDLDFGFALASMAPVACFFDLQTTSADRVQKIMKMIANKNGSCKFFVFLADDGQHWDRVAGEPRAFFIGHGGSLDVVRRVLNING